MDDFRLKVFASAAKNLNFSKCAEQMHISQPAVSKHISELENHFGVSLFKRGNTGVSLTKAGKILLSFSEKLIEQYRIMEYEMGLQKGAVTGSLNIGASTTVAQYFLPPILAGFMERFDGVRISVKSGNSENVEKWLSDGIIDMGFVENAGKKNGLHYEHMADDELVLAAKSHGRYAQTDSVTLDCLKSVPLVLRENGSGTREIIETCLASRGIRLQDMNIAIELDSTQAIKSFISESDCAAIVSVIAIREELFSGQLKIIDIDGFEMKRGFASVFRQGEMNGLRERFHLFAKHFSK